MSEPLTIDKKTVTRKTMSKDEIRPYYDKLKQNDKFLFGCVTQEEDGSFTCVACWQSDEPNPEKGLLAAFLVK